MWCDLFILCAFTIGCGYFLHHWVIPAGWLQEVPPFDSYSRLLYVIVHFHSIFPVTTFVSIQSWETFISIFLKQTHFPDVVMKRLCPALVKIIESYFTSFLFNHVFTALFSAAGFRGCSEKPPQCGVCLFLNLWYNFVLPSSEVQLGKLYQRGWVTCKDAELTLFWGLVLLHSKLDVFVSSKSPKCTSKNRLWPVLPPRGCSFHGTQVAPTTLQVTPNELRQ